MASLHRNPGFSSKWILMAFIVSTLVAMTTSQRFTMPTFPTRRARRTTANPTTTTTTTAQPTTTTAKPYTYTKPASCTSPPPYTTTTTTAAPAERAAPKLGTCSLAETAKQVMGQSVRWPNKTVPYTISDAFEPCQRDLIMAAIWEIGNKSCIRFRPKTDSDVDYAEFVNTKPQTCSSSSIGFMGGVHTINLGDVPNFDGNWGFCFYLQTDTSQPGSGLAAHEILHTLGFQHEHQRPDRNESIVVHYENILDGFAFNFDIPEGQTIIGPYDLKSIMHYRSDSFAKDGTHSMDPILPGTEIQEGDFLNDGDVFKLKTYYECF